MKLTFNNAPRSNGQTVKDQVNTRVKNEVKAKVDEVNEQCTNILLIFNACVNALINASLILLIAYCRWTTIDKVAVMTTDELVAVSQDLDSSDGTATKHFLITLIIFDRQITAV